MANLKTFNYIQRGVKKLVERRTLHNGMEFRPTQGDAIRAYHDFLEREDLTQEQKLKGFFEIPTGVGKTAMFLAVLDEAHKTARAEGDKLRAMIVVPTIPILEQMEDEVQEWAPDYLDMMGFYGGKSRNIGDELTIITYDSWVALMEKGEIDSTNIDILISDEAHRGTSERRLTNQFNAFANGTAQLAFTATARFDEEKSVEQSHGQQIFSRGVAESIRLGELAAYAQTQLYVIRVQPLPAQDALEEGKERDVAYEAAVRSGMKQEAWMQQMVAVWRDGRDEHTGDPLTDNKSGFYLFGTDMADRFAELASADPVLQERAREQGCEHVIASVHSKMSAGRQKQILDDFKQGKILGLVSDEKLKEGFNFPAMKNVFDYPRSSLVDKAQIIGRAARQWWNPAKKRNEGATIVDSIVYMGSNDLEEDKRLRDAAIRNAVVAWSVLEGTAVFSTKEEFRTRSSDTPRPNASGGVKPVLGLDVTSHITLEELQAIYAEQKHLQGENRIEITDQMRDELSSLMKIKGVGPVAIVTSGNLSDVPVTMIHNWKSGLSRSAPYELWNDVFNVLSGMPDAQALVTISKSMRSELNSLFESKGVGVKSVLKNIQNAEIKPSTVEQWRRSTSTAVKEHWDMVCDVLRSLDNTERVEKIEFTEDMRAELNTLMEEKGVKSTILSRNMDMDGVTTAILDLWKAGKYKEIPISAWSKAIETLKDFPNVGERIDFTKEMQENLLQLMDKKNYGVTALVRFLDDPSINGSTLNHWRKKAVKKIPAQSWTKVISALDSLPDVIATETVKITDDMHQNLNSLIESKGIKPSQLFKAVDVDGLSADLIYRWQYRTMKSANKNLWDKTMRKLESMPDIAPREIIEISISMREELNDLLERKGIGANRLAQVIGEDDISAPLIETWRRNAKRVDREQWDRVVGTLGGLSDMQKLEKIVITEGLRTELDRLFNEKGIGPVALTKSNSDLGVPASMVKNWRRGGAKVADKDKWEGIIAALESLPDAAPKNTAKSQLNPQPKSPGMG